MRALIASLFLVFLAACNTGPDADTVRLDVNERLAQVLPDGVVELVDLERRGSQKDTRAPADEERRIVYFDAELELVRDINFGAWNAPGLSGLISALGAGPRGIQGIKSGGNKAGDIITAHGTALYLRHEGAWASFIPAGYQPAIAPGFVSGADHTSAALAALRRVAELFPRDTSPEQNAAITQELAAAQTSIQARLARLSDGYAIAAGAEHGQYLRVARALFGAGESRAVPLITRGGEENLRLLRSGKVSLALAQGDAALDAYQGTGVFEGQGPHIALRGVASLYPEPMHVLVREDGKLTSLSDLRGKRVAIGESGSASRITALRVLKAQGLTLEDIVPLELSISKGLQALEQGSADAVFQVIGTPADSVRDLLTALPLRMLPLSDKAVAQLTEANQGYFAYTIQKGTYPGQKEDVATIATAALLLTDTVFSEAEIEAMTRNIFQKGHDYSSLGSAQGAQISVATSRMGLSVPIHTAAARALEEMERADATAKAASATTAPAEPPAN